MWPERKLVFLRKKKLEVSILQLNFQQSENSQNNPIYQYQKYYNFDNSRKKNYIIIVKTSKKVLKNAQNSFLESNNLSLKAMKTKEVLQQRQCENWGELSLSSNKSESLLDAFVLEENGLDIAFQDIEQAWEKYELLKLSI